MKGVRNLKEFKQTSFKCLQFQDFYQT